MLIKYPFLSRFSLPFFSSAFLSVIQISIRRPLMAALQSPTEVLQVKPSFADMVRGSHDQVVDAMKEASSYKGEPALDFTDSEVHQLSSPLHFVLIGKFITEHLAKGLQNHWVQR